MEYYFFKLDKVSHYQIADLERLTGVKSHTIRIWEKRYGIINPHRTPTNIRYYDDVQAKKLLKISTLLESGLKISKIADLSDKELNSKIGEAQKSNNEDIISTGFINELVSAMLGFDETEFNRTFSNTVVKLGVFQAMLRVFYPFLRKTGVMWSMAEAMPIQEHFATSIIRKKLISAIDGLPIPTKKGKKFVLFLPPDEWHETGLLFSEYIIRSNGYQTVYLGQNVPLENLKEVVASTKPTHLFTIYITRRGQQQVQSEIKYLAKTYPSLKLFISASSLVKNSILWAKNTLLLEEPNDLLKALKS